MDLPPDDATGGVISREEPPPKTSPSPEEQVPNIPLRIVDLASLCYEQQDQVGKDAHKTPESKEKDPGELNEENGKDSAEVGENSALETVLDCVKDLSEHKFVGNNQASVKNCEKGHASGVEQKSKQLAKAGDELQNGSMKPKVVIKPEPKGEFDDYYSPFSSNGFPAKTAKKENIVKESRKEGPMKMKPAATFNIPGSRTWSARRTVDLVKRAAETGVVGLDATDPSTIDNSRLMKSAWKWCDVVGDTYNGFVAKAVPMQGPAPSGKERYDNAQYRHIDWGPPKDCDIRLPYRTYQRDMMFDHGDLRKLGFPDEALAAWPKRPFCMKAMETFQLQWLRVSTLQSVAVEELLKSMHDRLQGTEHYAALMRSAEDVADLTALQCNRSAMAAFSTCRMLRRIILDTTLLPNPLLKKYLAEPFSKVLFQDERDYRAPFSARNYADKEGEGKRRKERSRSASKSRHRHRSVSRTRRHRSRSFSDRRSRSLSTTKRKTATGDRYEDDHRRRSPSRSHKRHDRRRSHSRDHAYEPEDYYERESHKGARSDSRHHQGRSDYSKDGYYEGEDGHARSDRHHDSGGKSGRKEDYRYEEGDYESRGRDRQVSGNSDYDHSVPSTSRQGCQRRGSDPVGYGEGSQSRRGLKRGRDYDWEDEEHHSSHRDENEQPRSNGHQSYESSSKRARNHHDHERDYERHEDGLNRRTTRTGPGRDDCDEEESEYVGSYGEVNDREESPGITAAGLEVILNLARSAFEPKAGGEAKQRPSRGSPRGRQQERASRVSLVKELKRLLDAIKD